VTVYQAPREWTRVHPVSPFLGSGPVVGFLAIYGISRLTPNWVFGGEEEYGPLNEVPFPLIILGGLLIIGAVIGFGVLAWRRNEYRIGDDAMYHRKGIVFRQHRQARLDRIEAVDVVQPLLARIFGLAKLDVQVAGGGNSGVDLSYLRLGEAEALRNEMLALVARAKSTPDAVVTPDADLASGVVTEEERPAAASGPAWAVTIAEHNPQTAVPAAPERVVVKVPLSRLLLSLALSSATVVLGVTVIGTAIAAIIVGSVVAKAFAAAVGTSLFAGLAFFAGLFSFFWNQLNAGFNFTASTSSDGLRLSHGLLETRRQTVTPGRVQAVLIRQTWLWRYKGLYRITMNVAGYQDAEQQKATTLLPVGTLDDVLRVMELVLPEADAEALTRAIVGRGGEDGFTPSPASARLFDPLQWKHRGVRAGEQALFIRSGWLTRDVAVVPHARTQSLGVKQGPLQRLRHLASFAVHSTQGQVRPIAKNMELDDALELLDQQSERARTFRTKVARG